MKQKFDKYAAFGSGGAVPGNELGKYREREICTKRNPDKIPGKISLFHWTTNCAAFLPKLYSEHEHLSLG